MTSEELGYEVLGPVILSYLTRLDAHIRLLDDGGSTFLFAARAGVRIERFYRCYLDARGLTAPGNSSIFWVSRLLACKGTFARDEGMAKQLLAEEFAGKPIADCCVALFRHEPEWLAQLDWDDPGLGLDMEAFDVWKDGESENQALLTRYFADYAELFSAYAGSLLGNRRRAVIIDSGWQGTTQALLTRAFAGHCWHGLYFGRILMGRHDPQCVPDMVGLMMEADHYDPHRPESALVLHRHLIEALFEPIGPSIESLEWDSDSEEVMPVGFRACQDEQPDEKSDPLYCGTMRHVAEYAGKASLSSIATNGTRAMKKLHDMLIAPTREQALALAPRTRSADFGKTWQVPVLVAPGDDGHSAEISERIAASLWPQGQMALEFPPAEARARQLQSVDAISGEAFFDSAMRDRGAMSVERALLPELRQPSVAIITRTKDRPLLLRRAAESVARQGYVNYVWVVVNDGGDREAVNKIVDGCVVDPSRISIIHNDTSVGMEAASNLGIRNCRSEFVVIHDDDDSWEPGFLEATVAFLSGRAGARFGGVITLSTYVSEEIVGDRVVVHRRVPYNNWVRAVEIAEMACTNMFPPIAFLFRRAVWERISGFDESLPVLGDWDFNLRFLLEADIGVIPRPLANYHHRDRGGSGHYGNSVIAAQAKHEEFNAIVRNRFVRHAPERAAAALVMSAGYLLKDTRNKHQGLRQLIENGEAGRSREGDPASGMVESCPRAQLRAAWDAADLRWVQLQLQKNAGGRRGNGVASLGWRLREKGRQAVRLMRGNCAMEARSWDEIKHMVETRTFDVPDDFDEAAYLRDNRDVMNAVARGDMPSGYVHYIRHGRCEGRSRPTRLDPGVIGDTRTPVRQQR